MPRPARRPKKAESAVQAPSKPVENADITNPAHSTTMANSKTLSPIVRKVVDPSSDDEFGFHEIRSIRPVVRTDALPRPPKRHVFDILPDFGSDDTAQDDLSIASSPVLAPAKGTQNTAPRQKKTAELQQMLPRANKKRRQRLDKENEDSLASESSGNDDANDETYNARSKRRRPTQVKKTTVRKYGARQIREASETSTEPERQTGGMSEQDKERLRRIKASFEDVDRWTLETESVSSTFYSS